MDLPDYEHQMADVSRQLKEDLEIQRRKRREFGIKCCQQNALILDATLPKLTAFYIEEMKLVTQNKISSLHCRLTHEDLKHECIASVKRACSSIDARILHFYCKEVEDTLDASFQTFSTNDELQTNEDSQTQKMDVNKVLNFYNEEMKVVTQNRISPAELRLAHEKVKEECVQALKWEKPKIEKNDSQLTVQFQEVDASLEKHFELHKNNNELKEKICLLAMEKAHDNYIHAMSNKLEGKIMSPREIEDFHKEALSDASLILKRDLMYNQEDIDIHTEKLTILVKPNFEVFAEKNRRLFRVEEEIREFAEQMKLKEEAEKKEKASKEKLAILSKPNFEVLAEKNRLFRVEKEIREFAKQQEALEKKEKAAKTQQEALEKKEKAAKTQQEALEKKEKAAKTQQEALEKKEKAAKTQQEALEKKEKAAKTQQEALEKKEKAAKTQQEALEKKEKAAKTQQEALEKKEKAAKTQQEALEKKEKAAKTQQEALEKKEKAAKTQQEALEKKEKAAKTQQEALEKKEKAAKTQQEALEKKEKAAKEQQEALEKKEKAAKEQQEALEKKEKAAKEQQKALEKNEKAAKEQEALEKKEKAAKEQQDTHGKSNYNSTSIQKPTSPLPENSSIRLSSNANFSGDKAPNSKTIIAVEFGMRTVKCGIIVDGNLKVIPDQWGNKEFPNTIAITNDDEILIGHEVSVESASSLKFVCEMVNIFFAPLDKMQSQTISFRGTDITIKKELLCGLILSRIKSDAERFLNASVDSLVLTIPLCYSSTQRQAAKDAAIIGGFSLVHLITEPTAVALAYGQHQVRFGSDKHFLVIVANNICGVILIDAAIYHCKDGKVKMVTCVGNSHHKVPNKFKKSFQNAINMVSGDNQNDLIHSLLKECVKNRGVNEFALICKEREDKSTILGMVNELCKNSRPVAQPPAELGVLIGATIFAELWNGEEKVAKSHISDLLPYQIEVHRTNEHSTKTSIVFARHDRLSIAERLNSFPFECHKGSLYCNVYETGNVSKLPIADFVVPISSSIGPQKYGWVNFCVNWEGILRFSANYTNLKEVILIKYSSLNMRKESIAKSASFVASVAPNTRMEEEKRLFNDSKSELKVLAEFILCSLPQVQSVFGKDQMEKRASAAIVALDHPNITLEDVRNRISVLTKMKTKYISAP